MTVIIAFKKQRITFGFDAVTFRMLITYSDETSICDNSEFAGSSSARGEPEA